MKPFIIIAISLLCVIGYAEDTGKVWLAVRADKIAQKKDGLKKIANECLGVTSNYASFREATYIATVTDHPEIKVYIWEFWRSQTRRNEDLTDPENIQKVSDYLGADGFIEQSPMTIETICKKYGLEQ